MPKSYEEALAVKRSLEDDYRQRHEDFKLLRDFYHGRFWDRADADSRNVSSVFRDLTSKSSDVGPDIKVVQPLVWEIVTKYQTFLSPTPQCRIYVDPPESERRRAQATTKERYIYGCWSESQLTRKLAKVGWYLPLMGDCFLGIFPDFDTNIPRMLVRSPEKAFPIRDTEEGLLGVIFADTIRESQAMRQYPKYKPRSERKPDSFVGRAAATLKGAVRTNPSDPTVEVIEYSDSDCFYRWVDGVQVAGVEHKLGFNLFDQVQFIHVPDETWGHGAVEQYIGMNELQNALYSLLFQGMLDNIFPSLVLEDPSKAPEQIERGAGAVLPLNPGGKAYYLAPPTQTLQIQEQFLGLNEHNIRTGAGMPGVNYGESPASSIVTGKAVNELQGAATGATIEMVQGVGIGQALVSWNQKAIVMAQKLFRNDQINLFGQLPTTNLDINSKQFALTLKGKDLIGSPRNEVVFSPHLSDHDKLIMGLQGLGAGLWSKKYIREQMGIPDNQAMVEEIFGEAVEEGVVGSFLQQLTAEPTEENAQQTETKANAYIEGLPAPTPHPLLSVGASNGNAAPPVAGPPGGPPPTASAAAGPPGTAGPPQAGGPQGPPQAGPPEQGGGTGTVSLNEVAAAFGGLQGTTGRIFLVGEIVQRQQTSGDIEVALTADDQQTIGAQLPQYAGRLVFHRISGEPRERYIEVTPGSPPKPGGAGQASPEELRHVFVQ